MMLKWQWKWLIANKLSLNVAKTEFILIGSRPMLTQISNEHPKVSIGNKSIKQAKQCKMLGVEIGQHLTWKSNTENICKKVTSGIFALRSLKPFVDKDTLLSVYNSVVRPYFNYCSEVWDVFGEIESTRLQKLQNRSARVIMNMCNDVESTVALNALGWEPLKAERKKAKAKLMFKLLNGMGPKSLSNLLDYKNEFTDYELRGVSNSLCLPQRRTNSMKKSFMYDGVTLWNSLPKERRDIKSLSCFHTKISSHII